MMRAASRIARRWLAAGATFLLVGCASLFVATPPGNLYRLAPAGNFPTNPRHVDAQLLIELPQAPAGIDTGRIALSKSSLSLDYYADSVWTDRVPGLLQNLLIASFENSGAITAFERDSLNLHADFILQTEIRHFEAVYDSGGGPPRVWVAITARLVALPQRTIVSQVRFEQRVPAASNEVPAIVSAFNNATDAVLRDLVLWTLNNPPLYRDRTISYCGHDSFA